MTTNKVKVIGWASCYSGDFPVVTFTGDRKQALVECIRKHRYDFNYQDYCFLPCCAPLYEDKVVCELTKAQFDSVMSEAYKDILRKQRLLPQDVIDDEPVNGVLYEDKKYYMEGDGNNG